MFKVTYQVKGHAQKLLGTFIHEGDARLFVQAKLEWDQSVATVSTHYCIFDNKQLIHTAEYDKDAKQDDGKRAGFHPTPTPTKLRPPNWPTHYDFDDEEDE